MKQTVTSLSVVKAPPDLISSARDAAIRGRADALQAVMDESETLAEMQERLRQMSGLELLSPAIRDLLRRLSLEMFTTVNRTHVLVQREVGAA